MAERVLLTIRGASRRAKRSKATIERWIAAGELRTINQLKAETGKVTQRWVLQDDLLALLRKKLAANPNRKRLTADE